MKCKWCRRNAFRKQGRIWLCKRHYRFQQMRANAKRHGKSVPAYEWLEQAWNALKNRCPVCSQKLNWLSSEGTSTVVTLQHDRSGTHRLLCLSCNVRHSSFEDDTFYSSDPSKRVCPRCQYTLPISRFGTDNSGRWKNKKAYCRDCSTWYHRQWVLANKEAFNAKRRAYYHRRKDSDNPIPR